MKKSNFFYFLFLLPYVCLSQDLKGIRKVIITKFVKTVPSGKKWILKKGEESVVQVSEGSLQSGTLCNATVFSRPGFVASIYKGNILSHKAFAIVIKSIEKVPYANDYTFKILPNSILDENEIRMFETNGPAGLGSEVVEFIAGETVYVSSCLESLELIEVDDLGRKKEQAAIKQTDSKKIYNTDSSATHLVGGSTFREVTIARGLYGMRMLHLPDLNFYPTENCKVAIDVIVDTSGNVTSAVFQNRGSTTRDAYIVNFAIQKAKEVVFSKPETSVEQIGTLNFNFRIK